MFRLEQERFEMKLKSFKERLDHLVITERCLKWLKTYLVKIISFRKGKLLFERRRV